MTGKLFDALEDIKSGYPVIVVDSFDRENEGDLVLAAEMADSSMLAFLAKEARGLMCIPCDREILERLQIPMSPSNSLDKFQTPFTVSVDSAVDISTGVSVKDRMVTISHFLREDSVPSDLCYPGHLFPLRPREGLLKERQGHTEASIELMKLAGMKSVAIIIEIMNDDGSMARLPQLEEFAKKHGLLIISIDEIIEEVYGDSSTSV